jgi:microtubule-associated protein-like 6
LDKDEIKDVFELEAKSGKMLKSGGGDQNKPGAIPMSELAKDATHDPLKHLTGLSQELVSKIANGEGLLEGFQRLNAENKVLVKEVRVLKQEVQRMAGILLLYGRILGCYNQPMPADALNLSAMSGGDDLDAAFAAAANHGGDEAMAVKPYLGAIHAPSDAPAKPDKKKPKEKLILEWIYGFAGHTFNANIAYNQDGHFTYFNAAVGCVYNHKEGAMKFMQGKNDDDIMSFDTSHDRAWCATGQMGKDPKIVVWDSKDCEALCTLSGYHQRGVPALAFAGAASTRIISIGNDDDHSVALWETKSGDWTDGAMIAEVKGSKSVPMWAIGNPLVTGGDKHILFWSVAGKSLKNEKGATVKGGKKDTQYLCGASTVDGKHIYSGHGGGSLVKWGGSSISEQVKKAHGTKKVKKKEREVGVTSVCVTPSGVVSGGSDGSLKVWDLDLKNNTASFSLRDHEGHKPAPKCFLAPVALYWDVDAGKLAVGTKGAEIWEFNMPGLTDGKRHMQGHFKDELWACATHPNDPMIFVTAGDDKNAMYWDMSNHTCTAVCPMEVKGKKKSTKMMSRSACFSADGKKCVFALGGRLGVSGSKQDPGGFLLMDAETKKTIKAKKDRKKWMMEAKFSPDNKFFLITGTDRVVKIYDENGKFTKVKLKSSNATITHCDYSADGKYIQTNDNGYELLFYQAKDGKQVTKSSSLADTKWYSWTCSLGWPVQGIWPPCADGTDVNGVDRSKNCKLVATSDDFGLVKLFKYPCFAKKGAKYQEGVGHASHVTCVRFNADDTKVITVGGNDKSVFQWRVTNPSEE